MSSGKVLLGVLAGAAAGALAGILFAPAKGSKTRKKIARNSEDYYDSLKEKFDELLDSATEKFEKAKEDVDDYTEKVKEDVSNFAEKKTGKTKEAEKNTKTAEV